MIRELLESSAPWFLAVFASTDEFVAAPVLENSVAVAAMAWLVWTIVRYAFEHRSGKATAVNGFPLSFIENHKIHDRVCEETLKNTEEILDMHKDPHSGFGTTLMRQEMNDRFRELLKELDRCHKQVGEEMRGVAEAIRDLKNG